MRLTAVRHGQASFGSDDYDRLSERGWQQMRRLGNWLASHGQRYTHVVVGGMRRHDESWQAIEQAYRDRGLSLPTPERDPDFAEFDHEAVIAGFVAAEPAHPHVQAFLADRSEPRAIGQLLRSAFARWAAGELEACGEPWHAFRRRTRAAGARLHQRGSDGDVLLLSSGGVIAQLAGAALEAPDPRVVELNLTLRNSALAEFHALPEGYRLDSWNALPHLADQRALWTYF